MESGAVDLTGGIRQAIKAIYWAGTCLSVELFSFENLSGLRCALCLRIVNLIQASCIVHNLLHLILGNETSMVAKPTIGQVLPAVVAHVLLVVPLLLLLPKLEDALLALILGEH